MGQHLASHSATPPPLSSAPLPPAFAAVNPVGRVGHRPGGAKCRGFSRCALGSLPSPLPSSLVPHPGSITHARFLGFLLGTFGPRWQGRSERFRPACPPRVPLDHTHGRAAHTFCLLLFPLSHVARRLCPSGGWTCSFGFLQNVPYLDVLWLNEPPTAMWGVVLMFSPCGSEQHSENPVPLRSGLERCRPAARGQEARKCLLRCCSSSPHSTGGPQPRLLRACTSRLGPVSTQE